MHLAFNDFFKVVYQGIYELKFWSIIPQIIIIVQERNQEFIKKGEFSGQISGKLFDKHFICNTRKKGPERKDFGFFLHKKLKNCVLDEKYNS